MKDVIGVGLGPFNLGLAALLDRTEVDAAFFDDKPEFAWHPGLMLPGAEIQVPFLADLVTLADPTSPYSFLNYLHTQGRLYRFYFHERFHVLRAEYEDYCRWVASSLASCHFSHRVDAIRPATDGDGWSVWARGVEHRTRAVVLGVGCVPFVPECARGLTHSSAYMAERDRALTARSVTVVGSGQSAAEIFADLLEHAAGRVEWFTRSSGFLPMEYSKLGLEHFSPEYTAYFHALPEEKRDALRGGQSLLYKGIDAGTSERIYDLLYRRSVGGSEPNVRYSARCELRGVEGRHRLHLHQLDQDVSFTHDADVVILATGYAPAPLPLPHGLLELDASGRPIVELDYRLRLADGSASTLFVQNAELHTHGVGTPDLGLGAHRSAVIANALAGREVYAVRDRNVFQSFGAPPSPPAADARAA